MACKPGLGGSFIPSYCDMADRNAPGASADGCGQQPFVVLPEGSSFVDQQTLKLQVGGWTITESVCVGMHITTLTHRLMDHSPTDGPVATIKAAVSCCTNLMCQYPLR